MIDYREISQGYAQGGIKAAVLLNSGAAVAVLTQMAALPSELSGAVLASMVMWIMGATAGGLTWMVGFASTRYVDKWKDEDDDRHRVTSNRFQSLGYVAIVISFGLFAGDGISLAVCFHKVSLQLAA